MKFFKFKYLYIFIFILITFCTPVRPVLQLSTSYPGMPVLRIYSLTEPLEDGSSCSFTGIYDRQPAGPGYLPVIRVFDPENGTGFAYLQDSLAVPYGTCIKIKGLVIKEFLRIKPANEIPIKKIHVKEKIILTKTGVFTSKAIQLYEENLDRMQQYNENNKIALKLPSKVSWHILYDEKNNNLIAYTVTGNGIYESRMECVFEKNNMEVKSLYFNSYIKGE